MRRYATKFASSLRNRDDYDYQLVENVGEKEKEKESQVLNEYKPPYMIPSYVSEVFVEEGTGDNEMTAKQLMHRKDLAAPHAFNQNFNKTKNENDTQMIQLKLEKRDLIQK